MLDILGSVWNILKVECLGIYLNRFGAWMTPPRVNLKAIDVACRHLYSVHFRSLIAK